MKNYFGSDLSGKRLFLPIFVLVLAIFGMSVWSEYRALAVHQPDVASVLLFTPHAIVNGAWWVQLLTVLAVCLFYYVLVYGVMFFVIKHTLGSLSLKEEKFDTSQMQFRQFAPRLLGWAVLSVVTCFIYTPWLVTNTMRYFANNTYYRERNFRFNGSGSILFGFAVLCYILPVIAIAVVMILLTAVIPATAIGFHVLAGLVAILVVLLVCSMFYALIIRWSVDFDYDGRLVSVQAMRTGKTTWFLMGQLLLVIVTLGLYAPVMFLRLLRYTLSRTTVIDSEGGKSRQGGYDFRAKDGWFALGQTLLGCITLGIYMPWAYASVMKRTFSQTFVENI